MKLNGPIAEQPKCDCHNILPWLISVSLDLLPDGETSRLWVSCYCPGRAFLFFLRGASPTRRHQRPGSRRCSRNENHAEHHPPGEMRTSFASADAADIYHYSFDRQYVP